MSPVFRHGGLRLYLLKLLDEAPRHGYDVIRLLQDKFLGVYSPSPGTIYPRLARLEEEGLVTHETVDGKKVYRITDAGRAELNRRLDDLADLEDELAASVRDIAKEISRDVRETVRNLRDELTLAVRENGRPTGSAARAQARADAGPRTDAEPTADARPEPAPESGSQPWAQATSDPDPGPPSGDQARATDSDDAGGRGDWRDWADWARRQGWGEWASRQDWRDRASASRSEWSQWAQANRPDWLKGGDSRERTQAHADLVSDLEHLASTFATQIRGVARHAENLGDDAVGSLGRILGDTLNRIRTEVFGPDEGDGTVKDKPPEPEEPRKPSEPEDES
jgi:DNA-binding PadR family transcriptional regulator